MYSIPPMMTYKITPYVNENSVKDPKVAKPTKKNVIVKLGALVFLSG